MMTTENPQNESPQISVLMSVYNGGSYLADSIRSILDQSFGDFEFLIVDDASTDNSLEIIEEFARNDQRIVVLRNESNLGLTRSLNRGLERARGKYIARQDADDISLPRRFALQKEYLEEHPQVGVVGTAYSIIDERGETVGERAITTGPALLKSELIFKNHALNHSSVMARTALLKKLGGYDESLRYAQDYDLWWRLAVSSGIANLEQKLIKWRSSSGQISSSAREEQLGCMLEISLKIVRSLPGGENIPQEAYGRFWMACNSDKLKELTGDDIGQLDSLWELFITDGRYPPATIQSFENTVYRLYRAGNAGCAKRLAEVLERYYGLRTRPGAVLSNRLKGLIFGNS